MPRRRFASLEEWLAYRKTLAGQRALSRTSNAHLGFNLVFRHAPPAPEALAERDRALAAGPQSVTARVFGDPLPGRSALDRKHR